MAAAARAAAALPPATPEAVKEAVVAAAEAYLAADVAANIALGDFGADAVLSTVPNSSSSSSSSSVAVLTHCNAGALATAGHGTALGVIRSLAARGKLARAFCTETRPYNPGARLTAFELASEGFPATLLCDSAAAALLVHGGDCSGVSQQQGDGGEKRGEERREGRGEGFVGRPHAVVVGADRVAANGDTANKVGTLALAVAAKRGGVPFFVAAPTTTLDALLSSGNGIPIEQRPTKEVTHSRGGAGERVAAEGVRVWNPSFDVTPADLITGGIITEKGMVPRKEGTAFVDVAAFVAEHATGPAAEAARRKIEEDGKKGEEDASSPAFKPLDCASVADYVAARPALAALVGDPARISEWEVKEVGDGNINFVFVVRGEDEEKTIVVKQALPFIRIAPDWPLSVDRARIEAAALREHGRLLEEEEEQEEVEEGEEGKGGKGKTPSPLIPRVHLFDPERALIAMDFISPPAAVARGHLVAGKVVPGLAEDVAEYAAVTLFGTSLLSCPEAETAAWRATAAAFANPALCALTERVVFSDPYRAADTNRHTSPQLDTAAAFLRDDAEGAAWALRLKLRFSGTREALLHGDLHTGSVMGVGVEVGGEENGSENGSVNGIDGSNTFPSSSSSNRPRAVVIDPEFAFYGPIGFDLGEFVANLLMALFATEVKDKEIGKEKSSERQRAWLAASVTTFWDTFELRFRAMWRKAAAAALKGKGEEEDIKFLARLESEQDVFLESVRDDTVRFAGCCVLRRVVGIAHVEDFESIEDADLRAACEARALRLGREMMVGGSAAFGSFGAVVVAAVRERGRSRLEGWVGGGK